MNILKAQPGGEFWSALSVNAALGFVVWVWAKLNNTLHCAYGKLFVLHGAGDYHSGKDSPLLLNFLQTQKQR